LAPATQLSQHTHSAGWFVSQQILLLLSLTVTCVESIFVALSTRHLRNNKILVKYTNLKLKQLKKKISTVRELITTIVNITVHYQK